MDKFFKDVKICQFERTEELNRQLLARNHPDKQLQMQFDPRAVPTRTVRMPILDSHMPSNVPIQRQEYYNVKTFNPGSYSPYSGYAVNVDDESRVKNLFFADQHCAQGKFIPNSNSDLYYYKLNYSNQNQPYPDLFNESQFSEFNPNRCNIGNNTFHNYTKFQVKDLK